MHALFANDLIYYLTTEFQFVPGQLVNVNVSPGSILCSFDLVESLAPDAANITLVVEYLSEMISSENINIGYPFPLSLDPVRRAL